jgi:hypothetical protein
MTMSGAITTQMKAQLLLLLTIPPALKNRYRKRSRKPVTPGAFRPLSMMRRPGYDESPIDSPPAVAECSLQIKKSEKLVIDSITTYQLSSPLL